MFDEFPQPVFSPCLHRRIEVVTKGRMQFSQGEVWDDYQDQVICLDCLCSLNEIEVRETWAGRGTALHAELMEF